MIIERTTKYWHWWVIAFFVLTLVCRVTSCVAGALTSHSQDVDVPEEVQDNSEEFIAFMKFSSWFPFSFFWWITGMVGVVILTCIVIILTIFIR